MSVKKPTQVFRYDGQVPALPIDAIQTQWDLAALLYTDHTDPAIEADIVTTEKAYRAFAKRYAGKAFTDTAANLARAISDYMALATLPGDRPMYYFSYRQTLDAHDHVAEQQLTLLSDRLTKMGNQVLFFTLQIGKIPKATQKIYLKDELLKPYRYFLERVFVEAKHTLTELEEKILNLKSLPARSLWIAGTDKILNRQSVTYKKKVIPLNEAIEKVSTLPAPERPLLWRAVTTELKKWGEVAENELNAIVIDKKINDELRGYSKPYEAKVQSYENDLPSVEALVQVISTKGFDLSRKFYATKAKIAGLPTLPYASRYDSIGAEPIIPFPQAVEICRDVFYKTKNEYGEFFDTLLTRGHIDVYPKPNRSGGAFMSSGVNVPTMVFLNQVDNFKSLETLAHEMGHAIHSERSKKGQPHWYQQYSTTTAETASTFFENLVFGAVYEQSSKEVKRTLLHDRLLRNIATIQRQIAFFNFEVEMHTKIRQEGAITSQGLASLMAKHLRAHLGPSIEVTEEDGYSYVYVGHFRSMFYVYTYAYGQLMSDLMYTNYQADPKYITKVDQFLSAGGSATVENIFRSIGIDAHKLETFERSLASFEADTSEFMRLAKQAK